MRAWRKLELHLIDNEQVRVDGAISIGRGIGNRWSLPLSRRRRTRSIHGCVQITHTDTHTDTHTHLVFVLTRELGVRTWWLC